MDVKGKVVLVTGASEGIGAATASLLAARGAKVAVAARSIGLSLTARAELAEESIVVTVMYPGQTATNFGKNALTDAGMASAPPPSGGSNPAPDTAQDVAEQILEAIINSPAEQYMNPQMQQQFSMRGA